MAIYVDDLRLRIIRPVLTKLNLWDTDSEELLLFTAANESDLGTYLIQQNDGGAMGIYQMEQEDHDDIYVNFLNFKNVLRGNILSYAGETGFKPILYLKLVYNLAYATAMARVHYLRQPAKLPASTDIMGMANYYKRWYNTSEGAATVDEAIQKYTKYVINKEV